MKITDRRHFMRQSVIGATTLGIMPLFSQCKQAPKYADLPNFSRASPESQGIDSSAIFKFIEAADNADFE